MTKKHHFLKAASIVTAKAYAVLETLRHTLDKNLYNSIIFTDATSVVNEIGNTNSITKHKVIIKN